MSEQIFIRDAAERLNRRPATLRHWEREGILPARLRSHRTARGWRFWTSEQLDEIKQWMVDNDIRPGKGLKYVPTPEQEAAHLEAMRTPRHRADELLAS